MDFQTMKKIAAIYSILRSADVAPAVRDYCADRGLTLTYDQFNQACRLISVQVKVMLPTSKDMRHQHSLLKGAI